MPIIAQSDYRFDQTEKAEVVDNPRKMKAYFLRQTNLLNRMENQGRRNLIG